MLVVMKNLPQRWVLSLIAPLFFMANTLFAQEYLKNFAFLSNVEFEKILNKEFNTLQSINQLQTPIAIAHSWHTFIQPISLDKNSPYPIYTLLFKNTFIHRVSKFELYLKYGGGVKILDYDNFFFTTLTNYYLYRKTFVSQEHIEILKKVLKFNQEFKLPWDNSAENNFSFKKERKKWIDQYALRIANHFIEIEDWKGYRTIMRGYMAYSNQDNMDLIFPNGDFLPPVKTLLDVLKKSIVNNKNAHNNLKWTLRKLGNQILLNYTKNPSQLHHFLVRFCHEVKALVENDYIIWDVLKCTYHLFQYSQYNKRDIFQWLAYYYDYRSLAHLLNLKFIQKIPTYPNNKNLFHMALSSDYDTEKTQSITTAQQDYNLHRFVARILWSDNFTIMEKINALFMKDSIHLRTPIEFVDPSIRPKVYKTLRHFQCVYESWKIWGI